MARELSPLAKSNQVKKFSSREDQTESRFLFGFSATSGALHRWPNCSTMKQLKAKSLGRWLLRSAVYMQNLLVILWADPPKETGEILNASLELTIRQ